MKTFLLTGLMLIGLCNTIAHGQGQSGQSAEKLNLAYVVKKQLPLDSLISVAGEKGQYKAKQQQIIADYQTAEFKKELSASAPGTDVTYDAKSNKILLYNKQLGSKLEIPKGYLDCRDTAPKNINGLLDGVSLQAYEFVQGGEVTLAALGFANITFGKKEKITVVEFAQTGSQTCGEQKLDYGVGARMMLRIRSSKGNAKLNTPQQISASVTFDRADVTFSMRTFGIVGPGVAKLVKNGTMTENTYNEFIQSISDLIVSIYQPNSQYIITPQSLVAAPVTLAVQTSAKP